jgi:hypothetical protein
MGSWHFPVEIGFISESLPMLGQSENHSKIKATIWVDLLHVNMFCAAALL